jgi:hypothetical protein
MNCLRQFPFRSCALRRTSSKRLRRLRVVRAKGLVALSCAVLVSVFCQTDARRACGEPAVLYPIQDNTLYTYIPGDADNPFHSNGSGNFFAAGRTARKDQIQRGLILFDFAQIPTDQWVVPGTVRLDLYVVDFPKRDSNRRPFWFVPLAGLDQQWGEGPSEANIEGASGSGAGSGAPAEAGDATWYHTVYDPAIHDEAAGQPRPFPDEPSPGFWPLKGYLGDQPLDPQALYGDPDGWVDSASGFWASFTSPRMESAINDWLRNPASNFGWIVLGDETVEGGDSSSKRGFASRENYDVDLGLDFRPRLSFQYAPVPEPGSAVLLAIGGVLLLGWRRCRSRTGLWKA